MLGTEGPSCSVGVVHDPVGGTITLAALANERRSLTVETIPLSLPTSTELGLFWGKEVQKNNIDPEHEKLTRLMCQLCSDSGPVSVLLAVPRVVPDPSFDESEQPPFTILEPNSAVLKALFSLVTSGYVGLLATVLDVNNPHSRIAVRWAPDRELSANRRVRSPRLLENELLLACTALLAEGSPSPARVASMAALIAAWPSAYSYWSSFGRMFSSMDIVTALRAGQSRTYLGTGSETVAVRWNPRRNAEIVDFVVIEHALAMQNYAHLHEENALKVALVATAKALGITVTCTSKRVGHSEISLYRGLAAARAVFVGDGFGPTTIVGLSARAYLGNALSPGRPVFCRTAGRDRPHIRSVRPGMKGAARVYRAGTLKRGGPRPSAMVGCAITASRSSGWGRSASMAV